MPTFTDPTTTLTPDADPNLFLAAMFMVQGGLMAQMLTPEQATAMWLRAIDVAEKRGVLKAVVSAWLSKARHVEGFPLKGPVTGA